MAISYNENFSIGKNTYHIQTEYYESSKEIVSNIFKNGQVVKRIQYKPKSLNDIDSKVKDFHKKLIDKFLSLGRKDGK